MTRAAEQASRFTGAITIPTAFSAVDWHAHE